MASLSPMDIDGVFKVLTRLGEESAATALLDAYVAIYPTASVEAYVTTWGHKFHPEVTRSLEGAAPKATPLDLAEVLRSIMENNGCSLEERQLLGSATPEQYRETFKSHRGKDLHKLIRTCLERGDSSTSAKSALKLISDESALNALRIERYGLSSSVEGFVQPETAGDSAGDGSEAPA
jgi:hypothetical protein